MRREKIVNRSAVCCSSDHDSSGRPLHSLVFAELELFKSLADDGEFWSSSCSYALCPMPHAHGSCLILHASCFITLARTSSTHPLAGKSCTSRMLGWPLDHNSRIQSWMTYWIVCFRSRARSHYFWGCFPRFQLPHMYYSHCRSPGSMCCVGRCQWLPVAPG